MLRLGAILGFLAVAFGALAAHKLESTLSVEELEAFHTGVRYHMYHALAILALGLLSGPTSHPTYRRAAWSFAAGILLFSGSLYVFALTGTMHIPLLTPIGGLLFLLGWGFLIVHRVQPAGS